MSIHSLEVVKMYGCAKGKNGHTYVKTHQNKGAELTTTLDLGFGLNSCILVEVLEKSFKFSIKGFC